MNNFDIIRNELEDLISKTEDVINNHSSMIASDDQYDDPELWWSRTLLNDLQKARSSMDD